MTKRLLGFALVLSVPVLACSSDASSSSSGGAPPAATVSVTSNTYTPATVTVKVGETVRWTFASGTHNVVSGANCTPDNKFSSGDPGKVSTFDQKFTTAGTYEYHCTPHCAPPLAMKGQVIVQ